MKKELELTNLFQMNHSVHLMMHQTQSHLISMKLKKFQDSCLVFQDCMYISLHSLFVLTVFLHVLFVNLS